MDGLLYAFSQSACLVINPIIVRISAAYTNCIQVDRASDPIMALTLIHFGWGLSYQRYILVGALAINVTFWLGPELSMLHFVWGLSYQCYILVGA